MLFDRAHLWTWITGAIMALAGCSNALGQEVGPPLYESVVIEDVPHIRQKPDFCGEACAAMYLRKLGEDVDQDYVFDRSGLDPALGRGCHARELEAALQNIGFEVGEVWTRLRAGGDVNQSFAALHADLLQGIPSIVCMYYSNSQDTTEHFRLVLGYDAANDEIIYHEPAEDDGAYRRMKRTEFLKTWPLKWQDQRTVIRMRLEPGELEYGEISDERTAADHAQHVMELKKKVPGGFTIAVEPPFVIVGDGPAHRVRQYATGTVRLAVDLLKKDFFPNDPEEIIDVWLFRNDASYRKHAKQIFDDDPTTPYGYYSEEHRSLIMNIGTGGGTLIHEMVHAFMKPNFPGCPPWFNEGMGSLHEGVGEENGHLVGLLNWRLPGLKEAIRRGSLPSFKELTSLAEDEFYNQDPGTNYAQSRYLLYHLQQNDLLLDYYHRFLKNRKTDPTGYGTLKNVLQEENMNDFKRRWESWILELGAGRT